MGIITPSRHGTIGPRRYTRTGQCTAYELNGTPDGFSEEPILSIQHTRFGCGSVSLGVRLNHSVCDAHGFLQLMEDLAGICRGLHAAPRISTSLKDVRPQRQARQPYTSRQGVASFHGDFISRWPCLSSTNETQGEH